jgi:alkaline phosphatase D
MELTRRATLQAGLAVALSPLLSAPAARAAVANRVRLTTGWAHGAARTSVTATFPAPAAGNLLLLVASIDGSAGQFKAPSGWKIAFQRMGTSLSLATLYRVASGTETAVTLPWTTSSPGGSWLVAEYTGINPIEPIGPKAVPAYSDVARTSMVLNPPAAATESIQLAVFGIDAMNAVSSGSGGTEFRPTAPSWDWITTSYAATRAECPATALTEYGAPLATGDNLPGSTFAWSRRDQVIGAVVQLNTGLGPPTVVSRWVGAVTATGATVVTKVSNVSSARLKVSTDPALSASPAFSPAASPDANGMVRLAVNGLAPNTQYYYAVEIDGTVATTKGGRFRTAPAAAGSFVFAFGSCCNSPNASIFSEIRSHDPDLFIHLGDLHYSDIGVNDRGAYRAKYDTALASTHQGPLYADVPTVYVWSDHDYGPKEGDGSSISKPAAQETYRQYVPSYPLPSPTGGIYHTFAYGRVRFIATDTRSYRSPRTAIDNASKTMLGAEQKQWFKDVITNATEPVVIWINESPWVSPASRSMDWWGGYNTERTELGRFIAESGKNVAIISGDMHALAADDGSHSPGGAPVFHAAAFTGKSSHKGGPYTIGPIPSTVGVPVQQYGVMRVSDTGAQIALQFTGYQAGRVAALQYTHTFAV